MQKLIGTGVLISGTNEIMPYKIGDVAHCMQQYYPKGDSFSASFDSHAN